MLNINAFLEKDYKMDPAEKTTIEQRLVETGEKERLKEEKTKSWTLQNH